MCRWVIDCDCWCGMMWCILWYIVEHSTILEHIIILWSIYCPFIYPSIYFAIMSIHLSIHLYIYPCLSIYLSIYISIYPSIYISIHLSISLSIYLCLTTWLYLWIRVMFISYISVVSFLSEHTSIHAFIHS